MTEGRASKLAAAAKRLAGPQGSLRNEIAKGASGALVLRVVGMILRLATGILLARMLGAEGMGVYAFALALVGLLQVPTQLGLPQLITREVAALREKGEWGSLRGLLVRANQGVGMLGLSMAAVAFLVGWAAIGDTDSPRLVAFWAALPLLPIVALSSLRQATLRGLRHVVQGQTPEFLVQPGILALSLGVLFAILGGRELGATNAIWLNVSAALAAFLVGAYLLARRLPTELRRHAPRYHSKLWLRQAVPFLFLAGLYVMNDRLAIVILGLFRPDAEVGVYQVCLTAAAPVGFGLLAANATTAPHVARLWVRRELVPMQKVVSSAAVIALAVAVPLTAILAGVGGPLLAAFFGEEFRSGWLALSLVAVGQLFNAGFGAVAQILNMTGHTNLAVRGMVAGLSTNVVADLALIPYLGIEGAAIGTLLAFVVWNGILFHYVHREVGVISLAWGGKRWGPKVDPTD